MATLNFGASEFSPASTVAHKVPEDVTDSDTDMPLELQRFPLPSGHMCEALHPDWISTIEFGTYIPPNNIEDAAVREQREMTMSLIAEDLTHLLSLKYHCFWSQVIFDRTFQAFLDSYLQYCPRRHEPFSYLIRGDADSTFRLSQLEREVYKKVFLILARMSTPKENKRLFLSPSAYGDIIYQNWLFDLPRLMDIAVLYGPTNTKLVEKMISSIFTNQPQYLNDLTETIQSVSVVFQRTAIECNGSPISTKKATDVIAYISDISDTLRMFMVVSNVANNTLLEQDFITHVAQFYTGTIPTVVNSNTDRRALERATTGLLGLARKILEECYFVENIQDNDPKFDLAVETLSSLQTEQRFMAGMESVEHLSATLEDICAIRSSEKLSTIIESLKSLRHLHDEMMKSNDDTITALAHFSNQASMAGDEVIDGKWTEKIEQVKMLLPELGDGFVKACLEVFDGNVEVTVDNILENALPEHIKEMPRDVPLTAEPQFQSAEDAMEAAVVSSGMDRRRNIFDGDEFDVFSGRTLAMGQVQMGKKRGNEDLKVLLDDKQNAPDYEALLYEDEYDDTYDGMEEVGDVDEPAEAGLLSNPNRRVKWFGDSDDEDEDDEEEDATLAPPKMHQETRPTNNNNNGSKSSVGRGRGGRAVAGGKGRGNGRASNSGGGNEGGREGGRGRGGSEGGRGRGGRGRGGGNRTTKEKNKASRANHNRKRGADKKRAQGMGGGM